MYCVFCFVIYFMRKSPVHKFETYKRMYAFTATNIYIFQFEGIVYHIFVLLYNV
jgi:hypothetical protein